ncbi:MAG: uroporphyrinogen decarboxylase [Planctomycetes bacterium RBG_13_63_9]|nr:MAG: uroporphyrinogen decarboxylase [Planctomycetes bacterium RBG_13_63_9]
MTDAQWRDLLRVIDGELLDPLPVGLIVDCPWLPGWAGMSILDYLTDDRRWLEANLRAARTFPEVMFLPGFWAEYGMCTEPSAFGGRCVWPENDFPFAMKLLDDYAAVHRLKKPNCRTDGMCPFVMKRLGHCRGAIEEGGHRIRFATSRGPMNIATYLLGHTETLIGVKTDPAEVHKLLEIVTDFIVDWLGYQAATFPSIDGLLVLDDLIGFLGEEDFREFALPYFRRICESLDVSVKALHNDCHGLITGKYLGEMGFNLFNFSFEHGLDEMRRAAGDAVTLLGNIPPREVLAQGTAEEVRRSVGEALAPVGDNRRLVLSAGGGAPPDVPTANIRALCAAAGWAPAV